MARLYDEGFIQADTLQWGAAEGELYLAGEIACLGNIRIQVVKCFGAVPDSLDDEIHTVDYSYTAVVSGHGRIMQLDANHPHAGHGDAHHRHDLDWRTDKDLPGSPSWVGESNWQTLAEFIRDVARWYWGARGSLPAPEEIPEPAYPHQVRGVPGFTVIDLKF